MFCIAQVTGPAVVSPNLFALAVYTGLALAVGITLLVLSALLGPRRRDPEKNTTYECGVPLFDSAREPFKHFLMGYLTAYNAVADDTYSALGGLNLNQAIEWLDDFCDAHAMDSFDRAIGRLLIAHHETRDRGKAATTWLAVRHRTN